MKAQLVKESLESFNIYKYLDFEKLKPGRQLNQTEGIKLLDLIAASNMQYTDFEYSESLDEINLGSADCLEFIYGNNEFKAFLCISKVNKGYIIKMKVDNDNLSYIDNADEEYKCDTLEEVAEDFASFTTDIHDEILNGTGQ